MPSFSCATCAAQFPQSEQPPTACPICEDERQYVALAGQQWTSREELISRSGPTLPAGTQACWQMGRHAPSWMHASASTGARQPYTGQLCLSQRDLA